MTAAAIADIARVAEVSGYAAVHVTDHPAPDAKWLDHGGHHALDPFVALSFAAAATTDIKLLTNVYIAAYRNPFLGAKSIQSLSSAVEGTTDPRHRRGIPQARIPRPWNRFR